VLIAGRAVGSRTRHRVVQLEAPSIRAASSSDRGEDRKNARIQNVPNDTDRAISGRMSAQ
jgi:hypothetical protein